jgi:hypothetical protein
MVLAPIPPRIWSKYFAGRVVGLVWRTGEVALLGVEFGVVGGSSTHAIDEVDMREIWLYQMLYPDIFNSIKEWQIGMR